MIKRKSLLALILCFSSYELMAEVELASIEAEERAQIISELTYRLQTKQNCSATLIWDDAGSGADLDGYFFLPNVNNAEYIIGGHASQKRRSKYHCVTTVSEANDNPKGTPPLLSAPADWQQIWKDSGSGATRDGSFWKAIPADNNYVCLGSVAQLNHNAKPNLSNYRCVHKTLTEKITASNIIWSDKGSGADKQVTILALLNTAAFVAIASRTAKADVYDLKKNASSEPDAKKVEEILAQRMAPIKADIEAKAKALQEQKAAAEKAEAEKIAAAKKAKQEKLAAAVEKKKQEEAKKLAEKEAEEKALAAKAVAEQEKIEAKAAEKLKQEQQARIAKAMEEKEAAEAKQIEEQKESSESQQEQTGIDEVKQLAESELEEKEAAQVETKIAETEEQSIESPSNNESKGLNDILMFFLKIFGMMVGGVIIFMIAFKVLFGKKEK